MIRLIVAPLTLAVIRSTAAGNPWTSPGLALTVSGTTPGFPVPEALFDLGQRVGVRRVAVQRPVGDDVGVVAGRRVDRDRLGALDLPGGVSDHVARAGRALVDAVREPVDRVVVEHIGAPGPRHRVLVLVHRHELEPGGGRCRRLGVDALGGL